MQYHPVPGVCLIEPLEEESIVRTRAKEPSQLRRGKVVAVGDDYLTDQNAILKAENYAKVGEIVTFLSYQGDDYDTVYLDNKKYYITLFKDLRLRHG